jgi:hypothetical protein
VVTVIIAVPALTPVTMPLLSTVATAGSLLDQVTTLLVALSGYIIDINLTVSSTKIEVSDTSIATFSTGIVSAYILTSTEPPTSEPSLAVALTVTVPTLVAVNMPSSLIVAVPVPLSTDQVTSLLVAVSVSTWATICNVLPFKTEVLLLLVVTIMLLTFSTTITFLVTSTALLPGR